MDSTATGEAAARRGSKATPRKPFMMGGAIRMNQNTRTKIEERECNSSREMRFK
jgi:hypothetical protein